MLWSLGNSGLRESVNVSGVRTPSAHATENVEQVFDVGKRIDQLVNNFGKSVLQRVVVNRGEVKVDRYVAKVVVIEFL